LLMSNVIPFINILCLQKRGPTSTGVTSSVIITIFLARQDFEHALLPSTSFLSKISLLPASMYRQTKNKAFSTCICCWTHKGKKSWGCHCHENIKGIVRKQNLL
jgi:hypothetical protein